MALHGAEAHSMSIDRSSTHGLLYLSVSLSVSVCAPSSSYPAISVSHTRDGRQSFMRMAGLGSTSVLVIPVSDTRIGMGK